MVHPSRFILMEYSVPPIHPSKRSQLPPRSRLAPLIISPFLVHCADAVNGRTRRMRFSSTRDARFPFSTRRTPRRVLSCVSPSLDAPITRLESSGKRGCIALPSIAFPSSSSRIIDVVETRRFDNRCEARRNHFLRLSKDIFRLSFRDRISARFNLTLNSGKLGRICIRFAARPRRDEVRRRDLVKGDFTIISPLSLFLEDRENWSRISYGSYITDATRIRGFACPLRLSCIFNAVLLLVASSTNTASSKRCRFKARRQCKSVPSTVHSPRVF